MRHMTPIKWQVQPDTILTSKKNNKPYNSSLKI